MDALSRMPYQQCSRNIHHPYLPSSLTSVSTLKVPQIPGVCSIQKEQLADPSLGTILREKEANQKRNFGERVCKQIQPPTPADMGSTDSTCT